MGQLSRKLIDTQVNRIQYNFHFEAQKTVFMNFETQNSRKENFLPQNENRKIQFLRFFQTKSISARSTRTTTTFYFEI